jgi:hypothetical protein
MVRYLPPPHALILVIRMCHPDGFMHTRIGGQLESLGLAKLTQWAEYDGSFDVQHEDDPAPDTKVKAEAVIRLKESFMRWFNKFQKDLASYKHDLAEERSKRARIGGEHGELQEGYC